mgnify:FL=1
MELKKKSFGFNEFYIRDNKSDEWVIREVIDPKTYQKALNINKNDIVLDLGLNIGAYCVFWGYKAKECYAYEPEIENFNIAVKNVELNKLKNCYLFNTAVVGHTDKTMNFYVGLGERKDGHSILPFRGREKVTVNCENINDILEKTKANKIKIDIEGAEYEVIKAIKDWSNIDAIIFEWHKNFLKDTDNSKLKEIEKIIKSNFNHTKGNFDTKGWMNIISAKK